ncbi:MAG TPA: o-succinylbenzoate synthase, partial [Bacteroidetes bacterium]|nr:o-succinylbenzoate synthase [Bacteroidota bacterium]
RLSEFGIHSIEQPIRQGQWEAMAALCEHSPVPIALDEELIGLKSLEEMQKMVQTIRPHFLVLKPSLLGGFGRSRQFIAVAEQNGSGWWVTSALEGTIGLNALAQWVFLLENPMPQGLGTGQLFTNNIPSPLYIEGDRLKFDPENRWDLSRFRL